MDVDVEAIIFNVEVLTDTLLTGTKIVFFDGDTIFRDNLLWGEIIDNKNGCYLVDSLVNYLKYSVYKNEVISVVPGIDDYIKLFKKFIYNEEER